MGLGLAGTLGLSGWVRRLLQSPRRARCGRVRPSETVDSRTDGSRYVCKVGRMGWVGRRTDGRWGPLGQLGLRHLPVKEGEGVLPHAGVVKVSELEERRE